MMSDASPSPDMQRKRAVRTALLLAALAIASYVTFFMTKL